jgi:hypothetical protein
MDNNEAREMDYANAATGPDHEHWLENAGGHILGVVHLPYEGCEVCNADNPEVCNADNPNRPTPADYCAGCGTAPCFWTGNLSGRHWTTHGPITLQEHEAHIIVARLDAIGPDGMRSALMYLSVRNSEMFEELMTRWDR